MQKYISIALASFLGAAIAGPARAASFSFENIDSLEAMQNYVRANLPAGTSRTKVQGLLVGEGDATQITHPDHKQIEKYIYDINLCRYYIWRWNISADYDKADRTTQIYVNGESIYSEKADDPLTFADNPDKAKNNPTTAIYRGARPRPEADLGEKSLAFMVADADDNPETTEDQIMSGAGPSRPDPIDMGYMHAYTTVLWRSIFDLDDAKRIVPFKGDCKKASEILEKQRQ